MFALSIQDLFKIWESPFGNQPKNTNINLKQNIKKLWKFLPIFITQKYIYFYPFRFWGKMARWEHRWSNGHDHLLPSESHYPDIGKSWEGN